MKLNIGHSIFLAAVTAIGLGTSPLWADNPAPASPILPGPSASTTAPSRVLVIPFSALNVGQNQQWISKGVQEDLIADLGRGGGMAPIAFDGQIIVEDNATAVRLARQASADLAVRGAAQVVGDTVRLTAQLIDAKTGDTVTTASATGPVRDILHLEDQLSAELRGQPPAVARAPATQPIYNAATEQTAQAAQAAQAPQIIVVPSAPSYPSAYTPGYAPPDYSQYYSPQYYSPYDDSYSSSYYYPGYSYPYYPFLFSGGVIINSGRGYDRDHDHGGTGRGNSGHGGHEGGFPGRGGGSSGTHSGSSGTHSPQIIRSNAGSLPILGHSANLPNPTNSPGIPHFTQPIPTRSFFSSPSSSIGANFGGGARSVMPSGGGHASFGGGFSGDGGHGSGSHGGGGRR